MLKLYNPLVVFFLEMKLDLLRMEKVRCMNGFVHGTEVEAYGTQRP